MKNRRGTGAAYAYAYLALCPSYSGWQELRRTSRGRRGAAAAADVYARGAPGVLPSKTGSADLAIDARETRPRVGSVRSSMFGASPAGCF
ncbi:hypothetical protein GQ55_1G136500 [Panicum hallii var. hallii]|uniref:Uncharacterized protein n=1 Tax=Panicum hallii var. hallii TaxID=1504633 RepID=A0A2T7F573_9POAL|nr:hypothetical protein GQ55_1G136500 [Panicum hallii var. hallii]